MEVEILNFPNNNIFWNILQQPVYRYLDQEYIEEFFNTGKLRLSSFKAFSNHKDEQRNDKNEGLRISSLRGKDFTSFAVTNWGIESVILSTSSQYDSQLQKNFKVNGCFKITRPTEFAIEISKCIPNFKRGMEGFCNYENEKSIGHDNLSLELESVSNIAQLTAGIDVTNTFFLKEKKYELQKEYRFIWATYHILKEEFLLISCPEAIKFCEKVT